MNLEIRSSSSESADHNGLQQGSSWHHAEEQYIMFQAQWTNKTKQNLETIWI